MKNKVTSCPKNRSEWQKRSSFFNCSYKEPYVCLPDETFTNVVERCHKIMGMEKGEKIANTWHIYISFEMRDYKALKVICTINCKT